MRYSADLAPQLDHVGERHSGGWLFSTVSTSALSLYEFRRPVLSEDIGATQTTQTLASSRGGVRR